MNRGLRGPTSPASLCCSSTQRTVWGSGRTIPNQASKMRGSLKKSPVNEILNSWFIHVYPCLSMFIHVYPCLSMLSMFIHEFIGFQHVSTIQGGFLPAAGYASFLRSRAPSFEAAESRASGRAGLVDSRWEAPVANGCLKRTTNCGLNHPLTIY